MKKNSLKHYAIALHKAINVVKSDSDKTIVIENFVNLLSKKRLLKKSNIIIDELIKYDNEINGIVDVELFSARPLTESAKKIISEFFSNKLIIKETIKPELIGGAIIRTKDIIIDASALKYIQNLKQKLI